MRQEVDIVFSEAYLKGVWWIRSYKHGYKLNKIEHDNGTPLKDSKGKYKRKNSDKTKYHSSIGSLIHTMCEMDLRKHEAKTLEQFVKNHQKMVELIQDIKKRTDINDIMMADKEDNDD